MHRSDQKVPKPARKPSFEPEKALVEPDSAEKSKNSPEFDQDLVESPEGSSPKTRSEQYFSPQQKLMIYESINKRINTCIQYLTQKTFLEIQMMFEVD